MLSLEEAITHCIEVAEENEDQSCKECAKEHRQLAEWLTELKLYRETLIGRPCEVCKFHETGSCSRWECVFEEVNADEDRNCIIRKRNKEAVGIDRC